jgi:hypothetical protein
MSVDNLPYSSKYISIYKDPMCGTLPCNGSTEHPEECQYDIMSKQLSDAGVPFSEQQATALQQECRVRQAQKSQT